MAISRRYFLASCSAVPLTLVALKAHGEEPACHDPASLPLGVQGQRKSLGFVEKSADPKRHCGVCTFFTADESDCGSCQLMAGAPVNSGGVCESFAARPA